MIRTALCAASLAALAQTASADPSLECSISASTQVEIGACLAEVEKNLIPTMDIVYRQALDIAQELDDITERGVAVPALQASQEAWLAYRDAECAYKGALFGGGSGTGVGITSCRIDMTRERIKALSAEG